MSKSNMRRPAQSPTAVATAWKGKNDKGGLSAQRAKANVKAKAPDLSLQLVADEFLYDCQQRLSPESLRSYTGILRIYLAYLRETLDRDPLLSDFTLQSVHQWTLSLQQRPKWLRGGAATGQTPISVESRRSYLRTLRTFSNWLPHAPRIPTRCRSAKTNWRSCFGQRKRTACAAHGIKPCCCCSLMGRYAQWSLPLCASGMSRCKRVCSWLHMARAIKRAPSRWARRHNRRSVAMLSSAIASRTRRARRMRRSSKRPGIRRSPTMGCVAGYVGSRRGLGCHALICISSAIPRQWKHSMWGSICGHSN